MLQLNNIVKDYVVSKDLTVHALKNVSVHFRANEFVSILGPSGCGKTTLLNIIGGLDHYTSGDMVIDGVSTKGYGEKQWNSYRNLRIGFVFQSYNLIPHQSIIENVELALTLSGISKAERRKRAKEALIEVGLEKEIHKRPNQLSGGQMQRVAIARALVNNPQIVLADEPTGALDSTTGIQVMELLKRVAQNHLVIMVTHNAELAEQYSTRIIRLKDGEIVDDTRPYQAGAVDSETQTNKHTSILEQPKDNTITDTQASVKEQKKKAKSKKEKTPRVKMSWWTSLSLSFKNLLSKKGRTIMTSIAGSIGIIGVALVMALSNGFNMYIANMQKETLSGYPVQISQISTDLDALQDQMMNGHQNNLEKFPQGDNNIHVYDNTAILGNAIKYNMITQSYVDYIEKYYQEDQQKPLEERNLNAVSYSYQKKLNIFSKNGDTYTYVDNGSSTSDNPFATIAQSLMVSSSVFQEAMPNADYVKSQYDVLQGDYPKEPNQVAIIVDSRNRIDIDTLSALGIEYNKNDDDSYENITFDQILQKEFVLVYNNAYYLENTDMMGNTTFTELSSKTGDELQQSMQTIASDSTKSKTLEIVGVLRVNPDAPLELYGTGILYLPSLTEEFIANCVESDIAKAMTEESGYVYFKNDKNTFEKMSVLEAKFKILTEHKIPIKEDAEVIDYCKHQVGASLTPSSISLYPTDFDAKDDILKYLDEWNNTEQGKNNPIYYTDATAVLTNSLGQLVNIISYVLIAFASISLLVSSVMIGIITYVSVIERTKEIGVLRSLGASKGDVSNIFTSESFLIGLTAGLFGILVTYLLCIPINIILIAVADGALTTNIAVLNPLAGLVLIAISCALTLISSAIPARMASKLDPVKALRSE